MSVIVQTGHADLDDTDQAVPADDVTDGGAASRGHPGSTATHRGAKRSTHPRLRIVVEPVRPSRWAMSVMITAAIAAFAAVGINVARVEGQRRLDSVHAELAAEQARTDALRRRESKIQSPAEVVRIATEELGLIPAAAPVAVAAPPQVVAPPETGATGSAPNKSAPKPSGN